MKSSLLMLGLVGLCSPISVFAQCVVPQTPANLLAGQTFAFRVNKSGFAFINTVSAIGTFTTQPGGYVSITETVVDVSGSSEIIDRLAPASGRWMVNSDCLTGMITFMLNREPFIFNFVLSGGGTVMTLTGRDESGVFNYPSNLRSCAAVGIGPPQLPFVPPCPFAVDPGLITGQALRDPPRACPVGLGNPLNLLKGSRYAYTLNRLLSPEGEQGQFVPSFNNPLAYSGDLTIQGRSVNNYIPFVVGTTQGINFPFMPNYDTQGRYVIYNDCSGGELLFMANGFSLQLEFVFSKADFSQMFLLRDDRAYPSPAPFAVPPVMAGIANRQ